MKVGDTFKAPGGRLARFRKGRLMEVVGVMTVFGEVWIDAAPVEASPADRYWHQTYPLEELMERTPA